MGWGAAKDAHGLFERMQRRLSPPLLFHRGVLGPLHTRGFSPLGPWNITSAPPLGGAQLMRYKTESAVDLKMRT